MKEQVWFKARVISSHGRHSFVEKEDGGYNFIIGSKTKDCREIAALLREKTGARGGGSAAMIQGSVTADEKVLREILI